MTNTPQPLPVTVTLNACPPGLFWFGTILGFKSEYATTLENPRRYQVDAYVVESGEYFHGGAKSSEERGKLLVQPIDAARLATRQSEEPVADYEGLSEAMYSLSAQLAMTSWLDDDLNHAIYERVVKQWQALDTHPAPPAADGLVEALRECNGLGSFNRRGDREIVLTFASHEAGNKVFEMLDDMIAKAALAGKE